MPLGESILPSAHSSEGWTDVMDRQLFNHTPEETRFYSFLWSYNFLTARIDRISEFEVIRNYSLPRNITSYQIFCQEVLDVKQKTKHIAQSFLDKEVTT